MLRLAMVTGILGGLLGTMACDHGKEPPPQVSAGFEAGGRMMVPLDVPSRQYDRGIVGAAATVEEAAAPRTPEAGVGEGMLDDSSPNTVIAAYIEILRAGNFRELASVLVPEQQETARRIGQSVEPLMQARQSLEQQWRERFPESPLPVVGPAGIGGKVNAAILSVEPVDDNNAVGSIQIEGMPTAMRVNVRRVDDGWRVVHPDLPPPEAMEIVGRMLDLIPRIADAIQAIAERIGSGEIGSANEASQALDSAVQEVFGPLMQELATNMQQGLGDPSTLSPEQQPQEDTEAYQPERQREAVDDVYSGPEHLRRR